MSRLVGILTVLCIVCLLAGSAGASRLILIPTAEGLGTAGVQAEYAARSDGDGKAMWVNLGVSRFELEGARFEDFEDDSVDAISLQADVLPETSFTPAVAIGTRDIGDDTSGKGTLYDGRSFYAVASKSVPITGGIPVLFQDVKLHGGIGTGSLSGIFFGVEGTLPFGLRLEGEYDTEDFNFALSYKIIPTLQARVSDIKGDVYWGGAFSLTF